MNRISDEQEARLLFAYQRGDTHVAAARFAKVCVRTVEKRFERYGNDGLMRGKVKRRITGRRAKSVPRYYGPTWIGIGLVTGTREYDSARRRVHSAR